MARVNITVPDELLARARGEGMNVSRAAAAGIAEELQRRDKIAALDRYLKELEDELGPISEEEAREAREWADRAFGPYPPDSSAADRAA